jgi:hypothetical protein
MLINAIHLKRANDEQSSYISKDKATKSYRYKKKLYTELIIDGFICLIL